MVCGYEMPARLNYGPVRQLVRHPDARREIVPIRIPEAAMIWRKNTTAPQINPVCAESGLETLKSKLLLRL
jgi:hypothetical protein